jgi:drug/metabolite transporter (DMT)-like permease
VKSGWMLVAALLFAVMGALVKLGAPRFSSAELVFYRSFFGLAVIVIAVAYSQRGRFAAFATPHAGTHLWRSLSGFVALLLFFHAIGQLPLATAITLNYTSPLFLAALSVVWLGERHGRGLFVALFLGFAGVVWLLGPSWEGQHRLAVLMGLASGALAGVAYLNVKRLLALGEPEWRIVFYFTLLSTLGSALWMLVAGLRWPAPSDLPLLLGLGVSATLAQFALTRAYQRGQTLVVGALAYTTVGFSSLIGVWLFDQPLAAGNLVGMGLIVMAGLLAVWVANRPPASDRL